MFVNERGWRTAVYPQRRSILQLTAPPHVHSTLGMIKHTERMSLRTDPDFKRAIATLRKLADPIPSASDVVRQAVMEKLERDAKPNGQRPKKEKNGT